MMFTAKPSLLKLKSSFSLSTYHLHIRSTSKSKTCSIRYYNLILISCTRVYFCIKVTIPLACLSCPAAEL